MDVDRTGYAGSYDGRLGYSATEREAAERARSAPGACTVMRRAGERQVVRTDRATGEERVVTVQLPDTTVADAVSAALTHAVICGREIAPPDHFTDAEREQFWTKIREHYAVAGAHSG